QFNSKYDPAAAKALLDKFGYKDRNGDGWREMPGGSAVGIKRGSSPPAVEGKYDELWQRSMSAIGIKMEMVTQRWADLYKMAHNGQLQFLQLAHHSNATARSTVL